MRKVGRSAPSVQLQTNAGDAGLRYETLCTGSPVGGVVRKGSLRKGIQPSFLRAPPSNCNTREDGDMLAKLLSATFRLFSGGFDALSSGDRFTSACPGMLDRAVEHVVDAIGHRHGR